MKLIKIISPIAAVVILILLSKLYWNLIAYVFPGYPAGVYQYVGICLAIGTLVACIYNNEER
jgi:hypothetical protein